MSDMTVTRMRTVTREVSSDLLRLASRMDDRQVRFVLDSMDCATGPIVLTGVGKSGLVAARAAASWTSVGLRTVFIHSYDGLHGDAGIIHEEGLVIALSQSGTTLEVQQLMHKLPSCTRVLVSGKKDRRPAWADVVLDSSAGDGLFPMASCHVQAMWLDALMVGWCCEHEHVSTFKKNHPGGAIGDKLR